MNGSKLIAEKFNLSSPLLAEKDKFGFSFETNFDHDLSTKWMSENWTTSVYVSALYVAVIFSTKFYMKSRPPLDLRNWLTSWSILLAGFSIFGTVRMMPEMVELLSQSNGFHDSVCRPVSHASPMFNFWIFVFVLSKLPELGDTAFIVLRKQPLIFLHWYHHITVFMYCWFSYQQFVSPSRWFVVMNFSVHALMYSYYALRALKIRVPKPIAVTITSLQIVQMFLGVAVNIYALTTKLQGQPCDVPYDNLFWALSMYASYFYLFVQFFRRAYILKPPPRPDSKSEKNIKTD